MISVEEALEKIREHSAKMEIGELPIAEASHKILAEDIVSPLNLPSFRQSAMDGFAVLRKDLDAGLRMFKVVSETQAGPTVEKTLASGQAIRIFTGAVVPKNADLIVIQEHTSLQGDTLHVLEYSLKAKSNIREEGEQIERGEIALAKGHQVGPASIGFLASMGIQSVKVYAKPKVVIITTGNELRESGQDLSLGEIYESNGKMLKAALNEWGLTDIEEMRLVDDYEKSVEAIAKALSNADLLILSGGISVGKYDFVKHALEENGVEEVFYKINQKPGKPMYFGKKGRQMIFALPGNPASLLVCFYIYVSEAIQRSMGGVSSRRVRLKKLTQDYEFQGGRAQFLKALVKGDEVALLEGQSSFVLKAFAEANALVYIHGENRKISKGSNVEIFPID